MSASSMFESIDVVDSSTSRQARRAVSRRFVRRADARADGQEVVEVGRSTAFRSLVPSDAVSRRAQVGGDVAQDGEQVAVGPTRRPSTSSPRTLTARDTPGPISRSCDAASPL